MKKIQRWYVAAIVLGLISTVVNASGPLNLGGANNRTPITYQNGGRNIVLNYDLGPLGGRNNAQIDAIVNQAIGLWNAVPSTTISLQQGADLNVDVTNANFSTFLNNFQDGINPVIYDTDGSITDAIFGVGASNNTLGFAGSAFIQSTATYVEGRAVINGAINISDSVLTVVFAHEIGHFFGLDHTQLDDSQGLARSNFALMYPIAFRSRISLHEDDVSSVSSLYPVADIDSFFGSLEGNFRQADGTPIVGANIWAREVNTGLVYSNVSDFLTEGNGRFRMLLPAGTYILNAESIQTNFTGGSSVGPFSETATSPSFQSPHPITPVEFQETTPGSSFQVVITAGCVANIAFNLDGSGIVNNTNCVANNPPVAENASFTINSTDVLRDFLTATDPDGDALTFRLNPSLIGTATLTLDDPATGAFTFTPGPGNETSAFISFTANDGIDDSNNGLVSVTINPATPNSPPVAVAGSLTINEDVIGSGLLLASDADNDPLNFSITTQGSLGVATVINAATGAFTYVPNLNANGTDTFSFSVTDSLATATSTVTVTINPVNDAPVVQPISITTNEDSSVNGTLQAVDVEGDALQFSLVSQPANGRVLITDSANGAFVYTPDADVNGTDAFTFQASDGSLANTANGTITIVPVNDAPVAQAGTVSTTEDAPVAGNFSATDVDNSVLQLQFSIVQQGSLGTAVITNSSPGAFIYTPNPNANGTDTITFQVSDGSLTSTANVVITIAAVNDTPITQDLAVTTAEDTAVSGDLQAIDADGDLLQFSIINQPVFGTVVLTNIATGTFTYTPNDNANGTDSFNFSVSDGVASASGTVTITVTPVNDAPVARASTVTTNENTPVTATLLANDVDGDTLAFTITSAPSLGSVQLVNPETGVFTYTPNLNVNGTDSLTFTVSDGVASSQASVTIVIDAVNDAPVASDGSLSTNENQPVSGTLVANDNDGDALQYRVSRQATLGSVTITNPVTGTYTYTPNAATSGVDSFGFIANDGNLDSNEGVVTVTIVAAAGNRIPVISAVTATPETLLDTQTSQLLVTATDDDGPQALSYSWSVVSGGGRFNDASLVNPIFTPADVSETQTVVLQVVVSDGQDSATQTLTLTVNDGANNGILLDDDFNDGDFVGWRIFDEGRRSAPSSWSAASGTFIQRRNIFGGSVTRNALPKPGTYARYEPGLNANDYRVRVNIRSDDDDAIGLMFRVADTNNYYRFSWDQQRRYRRLVKNVNGNFSLLAEDRVRYVRGQTYQLDVAVQGGHIEVRIDNRLIFSVDDSSLSSGTIALYNWANRGSRFDNVTVEDLTGVNRSPLITSVTASQITITDEQTSQVDVNVSDVDGPQPLSYQWSIISGGGRLNNARAKSPVYIPANVSTIETVVLRVVVSDGQNRVEETLNLTVGDANGVQRLLVDNFDDGDFENWTIVDQGNRQGPSRWSAVTGTFTQNSNIFSNSVRRNSLPKPGTYALYSPGFNTGDYRASVDIRSADNDAIGMMFRVQSSNTFYRFSWDRQRSYRRLVKSVDGVFTLLAEDRIRYVPGRTYNLAVSASGEQLEISIDGERVFTVNDNDISTGTIGLYNWANRFSEFDNVIVDGVDVN